MPVLSASKKRMLTASAFSREDTCSGHWYFCFPRGDQLSLGLRRCGLQSIRIYKALSLKLGEFVIL